MKSVPLTGKTLSSITRATLGRPLPASCAEAMTTFLSTRFDVAGTPEELADTLGHDATALAEVLDEKIRPTLAAGKPFPATDQLGLGEDTGLAALVDSMPAPSLHIIDTFAAILADVARVFNKK